MSDNISFIKNSDIFKSNCQTIVNPVNCVGVMGKGLALAFKKKYKCMYIEYKSKCENNKLLIDRPYLYYHSDKRWILNFPTKKHWKNKSNLIDIKKGLLYLNDNIKKWNITSIAFPMLGCGLGGLEDEKIKELIVKCLEKTDIKIEIYHNK